MAKGPRFAEKMIFRGFHFISDDEGEHVEVRLRVRGRDKGLFSTDPVKSIWQQEDVFLANTAENCYWLQLSEYKNVREMHEKAIKKVMSFLKGEISSAEIWKMDGNVGDLKNERFFYVGKVE